jgi:hypothetical protein
MNDPGIENMLILLHEVTTLRQLTFIARWHKKIFAAFATVMTSTFIKK